MRSSRTKKWEYRLKKVFDEIDSALEAEYGNRFSRHPARPQDGATSNPEMDGLFNVGASFSPGFDSKHGPGYVVDIRLSTIQPIPQELHDELRDKVQEMLRKKLPIAFKNKKLRVEKEKGHLRISGDLSLD